MKRTLIYILLISIPFFSMVLVNNFCEAPTTEYKTSRCTRYCHSKGCLHTSGKYIGSTARSVYNSNIKWLKNNGLGLSYEEMNILLYVVLFPFISCLLLWGAIRK